MGLIMSSISGLRKLNPSTIDEVWVIVRSLKNNVNIGSKCIHVPELSPSTGLFYKYLNWRDSGMWNKDTFDNQYVTEFISELYNQEQRDKLNELYFSSLKKNIVIACYCSNELLCHRSIVYGIIYGALILRNRTIYLNCDTRYLKYYEQYTNDRR